MGFDMAHAFNPLDPTAVPKVKVKAAAEHCELPYNTGRLYANRHQLVAGHAFPMGEDGEALDSEPFVRRVFWTLVNANHPVEVAFKWNKDPKSLYPLPATISIKYTVAAKERVVPGGVMRETTAGLL